MNRRKKIKVLFLAAEAAPLAKEGGLADVVGSLPKALLGLRVEARILMPYYGGIELASSPQRIIADFPVSSAGRTEKVSLYKTTLPHSQVVVYLLSSPKYFGRKEIYWDGNGPRTFFQDTERFLFFSWAALKILPLLDFSPQILHLHDYHTAMAAPLLRVQKDFFYKNLKTVLTIHNLNYQGKNKPKILEIGNLTSRSLLTLARDAQDGDINFLVQGILNAHLITTVSPTYAREIQTKKYGAGLEKIIRKRRKDLVGIVNGLDVDFFNPAQDKFIFKNYSQGSLGKKKQNKMFLQKKLGLPQDEKAALVGLVSRLVWQKGIDIVGEEVIKNNAQFVFLGTGAKKYENHLRALAKKYPQKVSANIMFDIKLANEIYAASDIFLMPSRFEPCGLGQMIAMRYGAVPVVRATGGLKDTVMKFNQKTKKGTGFVFAQFKEAALDRELKRALKIYYSDKRVWNNLVKEVMKQDFSWRASAKKYKNLYRQLIK